MAFQLVERGGRGVKADPRPAFALHSKDSRINPALHRLLGEPTHVQLLYDPDTQQIGLMPANADAPHSYELRDQGGSTGAPTAGRRVATPTLIERYNLADFAGYAYTDIGLADGGMACVRLTGGRYSVSGRRTIPAPTVLAPTPPPAAPRPVAVRCPDPEPPKVRPLGTPLPPVDRNVVDAPAQALMLRCDDCGQVYEPADAQNLIRHCKSEHARRPNTAERTPRKSDGWA